MEDKMEPACCLPPVVADKCGGLGYRQQLVDDKNIQQIVGQSVRVYWWYYRLQTQESPSDPDPVRKMRRRRRGADCGKIIM